MFEVNNCLPKKSYKEREREKIKRKTNVPQKKKQMFEYESYLLFLFGNVQERLVNNTRALVKRRS